MGMPGKYWSKKVKKVKGLWWGHPTPPIAKADIPPEGIKFIPTANISKIGLRRDGTIGVKDG